MKNVIAIAATVVMAGSLFGSQAFASTPSRGEIESCKAKLEKAMKAGHTDLEVSITGAENEKGHVLVSVYGDQCGGFPDKNDLAVANLKLTAKQAQKFVVELPAGNYAISVLHDENDDGKMNKKMIFLPAEGFGFSNNAMGTAAPPSFEKAKVVVPASGKQTSIKLKYY